MSDCAVTCVALALIVLAFFVPVPYGACVIVGALAVCAGNGLYCTWRDAQRCSRRHRERMARWNRPQQ
jgi:hypothetical protein